MKQKTTKVLLISLIIYFISAISSYFLFAKASSSSLPVKPVVKDTTGNVVFDDTLPKTEACPLNGAMYSKQQKDWWEGHRPLGVMIENHEEARPQSGISSSDIVYEAVAEGAITRFLVVFYCQNAPFVGPVRSARTYFLDFISEYGKNPLYAHVGGANTPGPADALSQIEDYGWQGYNDLNQFSIGFPTFSRDYERIGHEVATEHTMYSSTEKLWTYAAQKRGLTNKDKEGEKWDIGFTPYTFADDVAASDRTSSQNIKFDFWEGYKAYSVEWDYNKTDNSYGRLNGNAKHLDKNNGKQLTAKNIVVLFMTERHANDGYEDNAHMLYGTKGTGKAIVFQNGKRIDATWAKKDRESHLVIKNKTGEEIPFVRGRIWFEVLPIGNDVVVN